MITSPAKRLPPTTTTVAAHVVTEVAVAGPEETAAMVRERLVGRDLQGTDLAVCRPDDLQRPLLVGMVPLHSLLGSPPDRTIGELMDPDPPCVGPGTDQEAAAWALVHRPEASLAVIGDEGELVGLVPPARLLEVLLVEHEEDLARLGGFLHDAARARLSSVEVVGRRLAHRLPWLLVGLVGAVVSAAVVAGFEADLERTVQLAFFLPGIVYLADAVGTQTETLVVRGLSVGVRVRGMARRELATGLAVGALLGTLGFAGALLGFGEVRLATVVGLSLLAACSVATAVALTLPWLLHRSGTDPAFGSGPLATVVQDLLSIAIYLGLASVLLR